MLLVSSFFWAGKLSESNHISAKAEGPEEVVSHCPDGKWGDIRGDASISVSPCDTGFCFSTMKQGCDSRVPPGGVCVISTQLAHRLGYAIKFISGLPVKKRGAANEKSGSGLKHQVPTKSGFAVTGLFKDTFLSPLGECPDHLADRYNETSCDAGQPLTLTVICPTCGLSVEKSRLKGTCLENHSLSLKSKLI